MKPWHEPLGWSSIRFMRHSSKRAPRFSVRVKFTVLTVYDHFSRNTLTLQFHQQSDELIDRRPLFWVHAETFPNQLDQRGTVGSPPGYGVFPCRDCVGNGCSANLLLSLERWDPKTHGIHRASKGPDVTFFSDYRVQFDVEYLRCCIWQCTVCLLYTSRCV